MPRANGNRVIGNCNVTTLAGKEDEQVEEAKLYSSMLLASLPIKASWF